MQIQYGVAVSTAVAPAPPRLGAHHRVIASGGSTSYLSCLANAKLAMATKMRQASCTPRSILPHCLALVAFCFSSSACLIMSIASSQEHEEPLLKILVIGESGVGKTAIIRRYVHNQFSQGYKTTIGVDFALKVNTPSSCPSPSLPPAEAFRFKKEH